MIPRSHFTQIADRDEVDAKTVERDYVLTHIVAALGAEDADHGLVFKGGTALRLCHFEDYRYSADLDFSLQNGASPHEAIGVVTEVLRRLAERRPRPGFRRRRSPGRRGREGLIGDERARVPKYVPNCANLRSSRDMF